MSSCGRASSTGARGSSRPDSLGSIDIGARRAEAACRMQARLREAYSAHLASFELQLDTLLAVLDWQRQPEGRARGVAGV